MNANDFLTFAVDALKQDPAYSDVDMSPSSAFYNLTLLPFAAMGKPIDDLANRVISNLRLENMSESHLDDFASSFFCYRRSNTLATVDITLKFQNVSMPSEPIVIYATDEFRTSKGDAFKPIQDYIFSYDSLPLDVTGMYKIANVIASSNNIKSSVPENSIVSTTFMHPRFVSVTNTKGASTPVNKETNEEFIKTIQRSLSERSLSKEDGIIAALKKAYPFFTDISVVGYGEQEMQRDIAVAARAWSGHFGGMSDVYVKTPLIPATYNAAATYASGKYTFYMRRYKGFDWLGDDPLTPWNKVDQNAPAMPVIDINWEESTINGGATFKRGENGVVDYTIEVMPDPDEKSYGKNYRYSVYEYLKISVNVNTPSGNDENIALKYKTLLSPDDAQQFLNDNRDVCSSLLLKSYIPIIIKNLSITYDQQYKIDEEGWRERIASLINAWSLGEPIRLTTLLRDFEAPVKINEVWKAEQDAIPYDLDAGGQIMKDKAGSQNPPCYATMHIDSIDGGRYYYLSTQQIGPIVIPGLSSTYKTSRFFIDPQNIIFVKGSW